MTREEQVDWLCRLRADLNNGVIFTPWNKEFTEALNGFLEQEPKTEQERWICPSCKTTMVKYPYPVIEQKPKTDVLDKIRAEIQENINYNKKMNYQGIVTGLLLTLDIIDKYKAE